MNLKDISEISKIITAGSVDKLNTTISGVIIDSRSQKIGKNKFINIFKVDDGNGHINISFFEEKYIQFKNIIKEDTILFFHGEIFIDDYDSQLTMRADNVFTLNTARDKYSKYLSITLSSDCMSKDKISALRDIILKK